MAFPWAYCTILLAVYQFTDAFSSNVSFLQFLDLCYKSCILLWIYFFLFSYAVMGGIVEETRSNSSLNRNWLTNCLVIYRFTLFIWEINLMMCPSLLKIPTMSSSLTFLEGMSLIMLASVYLFRVCMVSTNCFDTSK